jgi:hypothetical protein
MHILILLVFLVILMPLCKYLFSTKTGREVDRRFTNVVCDIKTDTKKIVDSTVDDFWKTVKRNINNH